MLQNFIFACETIHIVLTLFCNRRVVLKIKYWNLLLQSHENTTFCLCCNLLLYCSFGRFFPIYITFRIGLTSRNVWFYAQPLKNCSNHLFLEYHWHLARYNPKVETHKYIYTDLKYRRGSEVAWDLFFTYN